MRKFLQLGFLCLLVVSQVYAAEIANLRNGFSIRHEHHEVDGDITRLYMSAEPSSGYVDVPTAQIEDFEPVPARATSGQLAKPEADGSKHHRQRSQHAEPSGRRFHCQRDSGRER